MKTLIHKFYILSFLFFFAPSIQAQEDDLLSLLGDDEETTEYATASFKTNKVINLHSLESTAGGVLDFKINHRFGTLNGGAYELWGLDNASMRLGFDYGITDQITVGIGRSSFQKTYDGFLKYKFLRQSSGKRNMPISAALLLASSVTSLKWDNPDRENYFSSRLYYTSQLIIGRKFSDRFSLQLSPTMVHRNLVKTTAEKNDVYAMGIGTRIKLTKRVAINAEYVYLLPDQVSSDIKNSLSLGFDIETGGHVFQLHVTNSRSMIEKGFIAETVDSWSDGGILFGFNISRVFTIVDKE
jgi:opacity protein-like surface antigen